MTVRRPIVVSSTGVLEELPEADTTIGLSLKLPVYKTGGSSLLRIALDSEYRITAYKQGGAGLYITAIS